MKQIMIAMALVGITFCTANAQTKTGTVKEGKCTCPGTQTTTRTMGDNARAEAYAATHKPAATHKLATKTTQYQVCKNEGGYYTCCVHNKTVAVC